MLSNIASMVVCTILYSLHTCLLRKFKQSYGLSSDLTLCYQYVISVIILLPIICLRHLNDLRNFGKADVPNYLIRCSMIFCGSLSWYTAVSEVPAVNCIAISCLTPFFIMILAKIFLNEVLAPRTLILASVGMIGVILIINPIHNQFKPASLFALLAAGLWASNSIFTKKRLKQYSSTKIFFSTAIILSVFSIPYLLMKHHVIGVEQIMYLTCITVVFDLANILLIRTFRNSKLVIVAPFDLLRVVFTTFLSHLLLNDSISTMAWVGILITLSASTLHTLYSKKN